MNGLSKLSLSELRIYTKNIFDSIDTQRKGYLNKRDIQEWRERQLCQTNLKENENSSFVDIFFEILDFNEDGKITLIDFENIMFKHIYKDST